MTDIKKIKRAALVIFCVMSVSLLLHLAEIIFTTVLFATRDTLCTPISIILMFLSLLVVLFWLINSWAFLHSIKKNETPFTLKNVRRLKVIALALILFNISNIAGVLFSQNWEQILGPIIHNIFTLLAGLVIYSVALVFQYGIALQTQVDETL